MHWLLVVLTVANVWVSLSNDTVPLLTLVVSWEIKLLRSSNSLLAAYWASIAFCLASEEIVVVVVVVVVIATWLGVPIRIVLTMSSLYPNRLSSPVLTVVLTFLPVPLVFPANQKATPVP